MPGSLAHACPHILRTRLGEAGEISGLAPGFIPGSPTKKAPHPGRGATFDANHSILTERDTMVIPFGIS